MPIYVEPMSSVVELLRAYQKEAAASSMRDAVREELGTERTSETTAPMYFFNGVQSIRNFGTKYEWQ